MGALTMIRTASAVPFPTLPAGAPALEILDDSAECVIIGYAQAFAGIRARIDLFLKGRS
jgi:hypothetical protein